MKKITFYILIFLFAFSLSGCNFLRGGEDDDLYAEDDMIEDGMMDEGMMDEGEDGSFDDFLVEDEEFGDSVGEDGDVFADLDGEGDEGFEEEGKKKKGFFSRLFGGSSKDEDKVEDYGDEAFSVEEDSFQDSPIQDSPIEEGEGFTVSDSFSGEEVAESSNISASGEEVAESSNISAAETPSESEEATVTEAVVIETQSQVIEEPLDRPPLNKILKFAYNKSGVLVNAVYIARPDENLQSISQKIYQQDKTSELLSVNTHLQGRDVVVGDKIYYNSPNRPKDNKKILFYYQDNNLNPSYYEISSGENIRDVAFKLLGHSKSWKEIWASNPELESKGEVQSNFNIVYWNKNNLPQASTPAPTTAPTTANTFAEAEKMPEDATLPSNKNEFSDPNNNDFNSDSNFVAEDTNAFDQNRDQLPQSPQPDQSSQPKEPKEPKKSSSNNDIVSLLIENKIIIAGLSTILIVILLIFRIILKKKKQRDFDYTSV